MISALPKEYVTFRDTKRKAQDQLTQLLAHRDEGGYVDPTDPTKMTLGEYCVIGSQLT